MRRFCLLGDGLLNSNGALWRRQRRLIQPAFRKENLHGYAALVVRHTRALLDGLHDGQQIDASSHVDSGQSQQCHRNGSGGNWSW